MVVSGAVSKVFTIPELLEKILLFSALPSPPLENSKSNRENKKPDIKASKTSSKEWNNSAFLQEYFGVPSPPQDLIDCYESSKGIRFILTSALVINKFWNNVINGSVEIQEALFFKWSGIVYPEEKPIFNPLLVSTFTWGYFHQPLLLSAERYSKIRNPIIYKGASWRRMLPVVPPIMEIRAHEEELTGYYDYDRVGKIPLGNECLHMGLLFDMVEEATEPVDKSIFSLMWYGSIDMSAQPADIRDYCDTYKLSSTLQVKDFSKPTAALLGKMETPAEALSVDSVRILMTTVDPRRTHWGVGMQNYPKLESEGKNWHLNCVEWGEWGASK